MPIFIERDSHPENTDCECGGCDWAGPIEDTAETDDAALKPGDQCPAGRCPECKSLAYVITDKTKAADAAPKMLAALRELQTAFEQHGDGDLNDIPADDALALINAAIAAATI